MFMKYVKRGVLKTIWPTAVRFLFSNAGTLPNFEKRKTSARQHSFFAPRKAAASGALPEMQLLAPVTLNIVCFRHSPAALSEARSLDLSLEAALDAQKEALVARLQLSSVDQMSHLPAAFTAVSRFAFVLHIIEVRKPISTFSSRPF